METEVSKALEQFKAERVNSPFGVSLSFPIGCKRSRLEAVEDRKIKGYPIVWGEKNDFKEIIMRGATQSSLNARGVGSEKNPIVVLLQHDQRQVLGLPTVLKEDDYGLYFEADIITGVQYADEALAQVRQGALSQLSVGFNYVWDKVSYEHSADTFVVKEVKLYEISLVTFSSSEGAKLQERSYGDFQLRATLDRFSPQDLQAFQAILSHAGAATSTPSALAATSTGVEKGGSEDAFTNLLKLF
jgi:HK97 family phage prohead protease